MSELSESLLMICHHRATALVGWLPQLSSLAVAAAAAAVAAAVLLLLTALLVEYVACSLFDVTLIIDSNTKLLSLSHISAENTIHAFCCFTPRNWVGVQLNDGSYRSYRGLTNWCQYCSRSVAAWGGGGGGGGGSSGLVYSVN